MQSKVVTWRRIAPALASAALLVMAHGAWAQERVFTGKERLGGKASDPQRVDDCKVPPDLRDPTRPRPTDCAPPPPKEPRHPTSRLREAAALE
ncbi:MAG: hypothetical protein AAFU49_19795 [Pseudomonadota bacterium]